MLFSYFDVEVGVIFEIHCDENKIDIAK